MDYEQYQRIEPSDITYDVMFGLPYGKMPDDALAAKFEETQDLNDCEDAYFNYAKDTMVDRRPDTAQFEYEEPRKTTQNAGFLQLIHYGGRGADGETPRHSELFLSETERDTRGINVDPDYRELRKQQEARTRFTRLSSDMNNQITGGGWNEFSSRYAARILTQKAIAPRIKIFATQKDGLRNPMRRRYEHVSAAEQTDWLAGTPQKYGDMITDAALIPQRKTAILSNSYIHNQRGLYQQNSTDHEFLVTRYGENPRSMVLTHGKKSMIPEILPQNEWADADVYAPYKAAGILMGKIIAQKCKAIRDGEVPDFCDVDRIVHRRFAASEDLEDILRYISHDGNPCHPTEDECRNTTAPLRQQQRPLQEMQDATNHQKPAHQLLNAELMYKAVKPSADVEKIRGQIVIDDVRGELRGAETQARKNADGANPAAEGASHRRSRIEIDVDGKQTADYRSARRTTTMNNVASADGEPYADAREIGGAAGNAPSGDLTQSRSTPHSQYRITTPRDIDYDVERQFNDNSHKERHIGVLGSKYMMREMDRDTGGENAIASMS